MKSIFLLMLLAVCMLGCTPEKPASDSPPNVVFIFADDLSFQAVHGLGNAEVHTPNLDRLMAMGTTFTHAYNMGGWNGAICVASRHMLNSGRFLWRAHRFQQQFWRKGDSLELSWAKLMEKRGYDTYMTGKWHVSAPADQLFQQSVHIRPGMPPDAWAGAKVGEKLKQTVNGQPVDPYEVMPVGYARPRDENDHSWSPYDTTFGGFWSGGKHWSEVLKDDALGFIAQAGKKDKPFFMYLAFNAPHDPRQSPKAYLDQYPLEKVSLPQNWQPDYPYRNQIGLGWDLRDEALAPIPRTEYASRVHLQEYYAIITHLDEQIGQILDALEATGKMDNTYLIFTADHGLAVGRHGLLGKQNMYEHSMRVPFTLVGPDIPAGAQVAADVYLQDVMPTSLELADIEKPPYVEFHSLLDLARGQRQASHYDAIYGAYTHLQRMIRKDGFKLIVYPEAGVMRLYDLTADPLEMNDLAGQAEYAGKVQTLFGELLKLQQSMGDSLSLEGMLEMPQ